MVNLGSSFEHTWQASHPKCYIPSPKVNRLLVVEKIFKGFLPYMGVAAILVMWPGPFVQTFVSASKGVSIWNLSLIGPVVSEKMFENVDGRTDNGCRSDWYTIRVKSGKFGHQVNLDTCLQTVEIQMIQLLMSCLIRIFTVCLVYLFFIPIIELWNKQSGCPN